MDDKHFIVTIEKIEKLLNIWRQRNLTLEGKVVIFKTNAISKIVHVSFLSVVPKEIIEKLEKNSLIFYGEGKRPKLIPKLYVINLLRVGFKRLTSRQKWMPYKCPG